MALPPFQRSASGDFDLQNLEQNVAAAMLPVLTAPDAGKVQLVNIVLVTGAPNDVPHGLGRVLSGWVISRINAGSLIYDAQVSNPYPAKFLRLYSSANCTANILVW